MSVDAECVLPPFQFSIKLDKRKSFEKTRKGGGGKKG